MTVMPVEAYEGSRKLQAELFTSPPNDVSVKAYVSLSEAHNSSSPLTFSPRRSFRDLYERYKNPGDSVADMFANFRFADGLVEKVQERVAKNDMFVAAFLGSCIALSLTDNYFLGVAGATASAAAGHNIGRYRTKTACEAEIKKGL